MITWGFSSSFPPDGHCHENYSEMHSSYSGNKVHIQFQITTGNTFLVVLLKVTQIRPAGDVISTLESLVQCFKL